MDCAFPREPSAWITALRLDGSEQYVLVVLVRSKRSIGREAVSQLLEDLLRLMIRRATCAGSPGTKESADEAADVPALRTGIDQSFAVTRLG